MWWKIAFALVSMVLGYWAWFDRRFYRYGILGCMLWAIGVAVGAYSGLWAVQATLSWITRHI